MSLLNLTSYYTRWNLEHKILNIEVTTNKKIEKILKQLLKKSNIAE